MVSPRRSRQPRAQEGIQVEMLPGHAGHPARPPLLRHLSRTPLRRISAARLPWAGTEPPGNSASWRLVRRSLHFDGLAPDLSPAGVDLAQAEQLPLHHATIGKATILDEVPLLVRRLQRRSISPSAVAAARMNQTLRYTRGLRPKLNKIVTCQGNGRKVCR